MATIRKRGDTWQVQIRKRGGTAVSRSFKSRTDALAWSRKAERDLDLGELPERLENRQTLADIAEIPQRHRQKLLVAHPSAEGFMPGRYARLHEANRP